MVCGINTWPGHFQGYHSHCHISDWFTMGPEKDNEQNIIVNFIQAFRKFSEAILKTEIEINIMLN